MPVESIVAVLTTMRTSISVFAASIVFAILANAPTDAKEVEQLDPEQAVRDGRPEADGQGGIQRRDTPLLQGRVTDLAGIFTEVEKRRLTDLLATYEAETTHQLVVLTLPTLAGESIESLSLRTANSWGLGRKDVNNGILITLAMKERRVRIELGYGFERYISNARAKQIIEHTMRPEFRNGQFAKGIEAGLSALMDEGRKFVLSPEPTRETAHGQDVGTALLVAMPVGGHGLAEPLEHATAAYDRGEHSVAYPLFLALANGGNARAQAQLGWMYARGHGTARDDSEALKWFRKAVEEGDAEGQNGLGFMYAYGRGVKKDDAEAVKWYRKSAEQGHARGQNSLAFMYGTGRGVGKDETEAVTWYRKSAEQGNSEGQVRLGWAYEHGRGIARNYTQAVFWYRKSAAQGNASSQAQLGFLYERGLGVEKDETEAVKWYRKAADQGNVIGQNNLGNAYNHGLGIAQDQSQAVHWFRKAAEQGLAEAQNHLGESLAHGRGVAIDLSEALRWFRKAAEQGHQTAQTNLGLMYLDGIGIAQDLEEAINWLRKAANQGHDRARSILASLEGLTTTIASLASANERATRPTSNADARRAELAREIMEVPGEREKLRALFERNASTGTETQHFRDATSPALRAALKEALRVTMRPESMLLLFERVLAEQLDEQALLAGLMHERSPLGQRLNELELAFYRPDQQALFGVFVKQSAVQQFTDSRAVPEGLRARACAQADVLGNLSEPIGAGADLMLIGIMTATAIERSQPIDTQAMAMAAGIGATPMIREVARQAVLFNCLFVYRDISDAVFDQWLRFLQSDMGGAYVRGRNAALADVLRQRAEIVKDTLIQYARRLKKPGMS